MKRLLALVLAILACEQTPTLKPDASDAAPDVVRLTYTPPKMGFGFSQRLTFTGASTAWTAPGGVPAVLACGCGAGGGGAAGGGGTAGRLRRWRGRRGRRCDWQCYTVAVVPGTSYTIVVGAGGAGGTGIAGVAGNVGAAGNDSTFQVTSSNNLLAHFPGASGGYDGNTAGDAFAFGGRYFATSAGGIKHFARDRTQYERVRGRHHDLPVAPRPRRRSLSRRREAPARSRAPRARRAKRHGPRSSRAPQTRGSVVRVEARVQTRVRVVAVVQALSVRVVQAWQARASRPPRAATAPTRARTRARAAEEAGAAQAARRTPAARAATAAPEKS